MYRNGLKFNQEENMKDPYVLTVDGKLVGYYPTQHAAVKVAEVYKIAGAADVIIHNEDNNTRYEVLVPSLVRGNETVN